MATQSSATALIAGASIPATQTDLLLLIHEPSALDRSGDTQNAPTRDTFDEISDADYATSLVEIWPTLD
jgi:hypothetical protein